MSSPNILDGMSTIELKAMLKLSLSQLAANKTDSVEQSILDAKQKEVNEIATALSTASDAVETKASTLWSITKLIKLETGFITTSNRFPHL